MVTFAVQIAPPNFLVGAASGDRFYSFFPALSVFRAYGSIPVFSGGGTPDPRRYYFFLAVVCEDWNYVLSVELCFTLWAGANLV